MSADNGSPLPVKLRRPATHDRLRAKQRPWQVIEVCLSMDAKRVLDDAERRLAEAQLKQPAHSAEKDAQLATLRAEVDEAKAAVEAETVEMLFESIGRRRREKLVDAHPPTQEDEEAAEEAYALARATAERPEFVAKQPARYNADGYSLALVAASCVDPKMTEDEWRELTDDWTDGEFQVVWMAALAVNQDGSLVSLGKSSSALSGTNGFARS